MGAVSTYLVNNWKTTAIGIGALVYAGFQYWATGTFDITAIMVGFGLTAAKDGNVTGGTKQV